MKRISIVILIVLCALCSLFLVACDNGGEHEHVYGEWTQEKQATCVSAGSEVAVCEICGKKFYRATDKLSHDYSDTPITFKEATCEEEGELHYECKNGCGIPKIEFIPRTDHDFSSDEQVTPATCTEKGERKVKCSICGKEKTTVLAALGHKYDEEGSVVTNATCEEDGLRKYTCERCNKDITEPIKAFGHDYGGFVVDVPSTLTEDGQKSRHCTRQGCDSVIDVTKIPKGEYVEYTLSVVRESGKAYPFTSELMLEVGGEEFKFSGGKATFKAKADENPQVRIKGLRKGYTQKTDLRLTRNDVELKLVVEAAIVEGETAPTKELDSGDAMYDFTVKDSSKGTSEKLSELMKGKKGTYIYFFYVGCGACSSQFPVFVQQYDKYANKEDILVVMVNVYPESQQGQSASDMQRYKRSKNYPEEFYMTSGVEGGIDLYSWVARPYNGVPFSYFLDSEGVIDEIVEANSASALREKYTAVLDNYLGANDASAPAANDVSTVKTNDVLTIVTKETSLDVKGASALGVSNASKNYASALDEKKRSR